MWVLRLAHFARIGPISGTIRLALPKINSTGVNKGRLLITGSVVSFYGLSRLRHLQCKEAEVEDPWLLVPAVKKIEKKTTTQRIVSSPMTVVYFCWRSIRMFLRCISLFIRFAPLAITYPLACYVPKMDKIWWSLLLFVVQRSGPTFLKLGQWASTRRDIFTKDFCDKLSVLHTKSKRKSKFHEQEKVFDAMFGKGFYKKNKKKVFKDIESHSIGSGCIAQVYKATIDIPALSEATGRDFPELKGIQYQDVAIKVADRNVDSQLELDLSILQNMASIATTLMPSLEFVDPKGALEQFEMVLRRQVDLRNEAKALIKFSQNFDHAKTGIRFPIVLGYTKDVLLETFEEGMYINRLVSEENNPELKSRQSQAVRRRIAQLGARALLKMIFVDNFVHGDLHPGNILIRFNDHSNTLPGVHLAPPAEGLVTRTIEFVRNLCEWRTRPRVRFTDSPYTEDEPTLVLLDTGIAISETEDRLKNLKYLFRSIVERKGYEAGHMLLTHSPKQACKDPDRFCKQVEALVNKAMSERSLRKLNISGLLSEMFSVVAEHHVCLDASFTTVVLSVMVLEGFGRSLDPDLDLFQCARPYLLNVMF